VVQRWVLDPWIAADVRNDPVPRALHLVDDLDPDRVEALPGIVRREARQRERKRHEHEYRPRGRQVEAGITRPFYFAKGKGSRSCLSPCGAGSR
jgi:hypothetical protein